jgi:hypothetical protein
LPFTVVHIDERTAQEHQAGDGCTPCVLAHAAVDVRVLLGPMELAARCTASGPG